MKYEQLFKGNTLLTLEGPYAVYRCGDCHQVVQLQKKATHNLYCLSKPKSDKKGHPYSLSK